MKSIEQLKPALAKGCRLKVTECESILLLPEGIVKLTAGGAKVLGLFSETRTVGEIVKLLQAEQPDTLQERISLETISFLEGLAKVRAIDLA